MRNFNLTLAIFLVLSITSCQNGNVSTNSFETLSYQESDFYKLNPMGMWILLDYADSTMSDKRIKENDKTLLDRLIIKFPIDTNNNLIFSGFINKQIVDFEFTSQRNLTFKDCELSIDSATKQLTLVDNSVKPTTIYLYRKLEDWLDLIQPDALPEINNKNYLKNNILGQYLIVDSDNNFVEIEANKISGIKEGDHLTIFFNTSPFGINTMLIKDSDDENNKSLLNWTISKDTLILRNMERNFVNQDYKSSDIKYKLVKV